MQIEEWRRYKRGDNEAFPSGVSIDNPHDDSGEICTEEINIFDFVKKYEKLYFVDGKSDNNIDLNDVLDKKIITISKEDIWIKNKSSHNVEENILKILDNGINNEKDVIRILAWKTGKINHGCCLDYEWDYDNNIPSYYSNWDEEKCIVQLPNQNKKEITEFVARVLEIAEKYNGSPNPNDNEKIEVWKSLVDVAKDISGLGTVYLITLLYFITKGECPIFDRFAFAALSAFRLNDIEKVVVTSKSIIRGCYLPEKKSVKANSLLEDNSIYCEYKDLLQDYFNYSELTNDKRRAVDRAIWAYGHIFSKVE